jgi:hypothetical protein
MSRNVKESQHGWPAWSRLKSMGLSQETIHRNQAGRDLTCSAVVTASIATEKHTPLNSCTTTRHRCAL